MPIPLNIQYKQAVSFSCIRPYQTIRPYRFSKPIRSNPQQGLTHKPTTRFNPQNFKQSISYFMQPYLDQFIPSNYYHVWNHAVGTDLLFKSDDNYRFFLSKYAHYMAPVVNTHAYCLMPNHFHFLIHIPNEEQLLRFAETEGLHFKSTHQFVMQRFSNLFNSYVKAFNKQRNRRGALLEDYLKRQAVTAADYYANLIPYIHNNPVKDGFVKQQEDWIYSSFNTMLSEKPSLLNRAEVLKWFGNKEGFLGAHF